MVQGITAGPRLGSGPGNGLGLKDHRRLFSAIELTASPVEYANVSNSSQSDEKTQNSINETFIQKRRSEAKTRCLSIQKSEILTDDDNCPTVWDNILCFESIRKSSLLL